MFAEFPRIQSRLIPAAIPAGHPAHFRDFHPGAIVGETPRSRVSF
jgi:hypothetical protein